MKKIILFSAFALFTTVGLYAYLFHFRPISQSQYQADSCFKDVQLKVHYRVEKVNLQSYLVEVIKSGHYEASPDFAKGTQLELAKKFIDGQPQYHPSLCDEADASE